MYAQYQPKGLVFFRIDTKESRETIQKFLEKNPSSLPILLDEKNKVAKLLGVWAHPTSFLVDVKGMVSYRAMGSADWMGVEAVSIIDKLLAEK
jgi:peroxiredoxin